MLFYTQATSKDILAHIEILLDLFQFQHMVPDTTVTHLSSDSLISYGIMNAPVSDIVGLATPPVRTSIIRFWFCMDGQAGMCIIYVLSNFACLGNCCSSCLTPSQSKE